MGSSSQTSADYLTNLLNTPSNVADNPQVQAQQDAIRRQVQATSNSNFSNAGTVGSTINQESFSKGLFDGSHRRSSRPTKTIRPTSFRLLDSFPRSRSRPINNNGTRPVDRNRLSRRVRISTHGASTFALRRCSFRLYRRDQIR